MLAIITAIFLVLSLFAPGCVLLILLPPLRRLAPFGWIEKLLAGSVLSVAGFILPLVVLDWVLQISLLKWLIPVYAAGVIGASSFLLVRLMLNWRRVRAAMLSFLSANRWGSLGMLSAGLAWGILFVMRPVVSDWDGWQYYVRDGLLYSLILHLPTYVPLPFVQADNLQYIYIPPLQPVLYAYALELQTWLMGHADYKMLGVYNLAMLLFIGCLLYSFLRRSDLSAGVVVLAVLIWSTYPITLEVLQTAFLSVDIPFAFFSLTALYFAIRAFESAAGQWFYWTLAALGCGLSFLVKIEGPLTLMLVGLVGAYYVLPSRLRWLLAAVVVVSQVLVFFYLTPALAAVVMSWHFALSIGGMGLLFAIFYGGARKVNTPKSLRTVVGMVTIFAVLFSLSAVYFYRGYAVTGSIGGWYTASQVQAFTPHFEWAKSIDVEEATLQIWRAGGGARSGLPQLRDLTPLVGYEWNPTLLIFAVFGAIALLRNKFLGRARLLVAILPITILTWWLVFGMDLSRQLFIVTPSFAVLHAMGVEQVLTWTSKRVTMAGRCVYMAVLLLFSSPFWMPFINSYLEIYNAPFSLTTWKGSGNWGYYTAENLCQVVKYMFAVGAVMLSVLPLRLELAKLIKCLSVHRLMRYVMVAVPLLLCWSIMIGPALGVIWKYRSTAFESTYTAKVYNGFIPALNTAETLHPEALHSVIMTYREFALTALTQYRRLAWNLADPVRNGYYQEVLTTRNMTQVLGMLRQAQVKAAILPADERNYRYNFYRATKYQQTDLPVLWLVDDSGIFPATRVGDWNVIDIGAGPDVFVGFVTVLLETDLGRGRLYRRADGFRGVSSNLTIMPVIDVSGLLSSTSQASVDNLTIESSAQLRVWYYDGLKWKAGESITKTLQNNGVLIMPAFDMTEILIPFKSRVIAQYYGLQIVNIVCRIYDDTKKELFTSRLDSKPARNEVLSGYTNTQTGLWVSYPPFTVPGKLPAGTTFFYDSATKKWQMPPRVNPLFKNEH